MILYFHYMKIKIIVKLFIANPENDKRIFKLAGKSRNWEIEERKKNNLAKRVSQFMHWFLILPKEGYLENYNAHLTTY